MNGVKRINPKILRDSGLLFEINRKILHPFGLALEIITGSDNGIKLIWQENGKQKEFNIGEEALGGIWDYRNDPEGIIYGENELKIGKQKYENFMKEFGYKKLQERKNKLGYIIQGQGEGNK